MNNKQEILLKNFSGNTSTLTVAQSNEAYQAVRRGVKSGHEIRLIATGIESLQADASALLFGRIASEKELAMNVVISGTTSNLLQIIEMGMREGENKKKMRTILDKYRL